MELWLLEVDEHNSYSYDGTLSTPKGIYSSQELAHEIGKDFVKQGYAGYTVDKYILDKTN